jgi:hypothetical protein
LELERFSEDLNLTAPTFFINGRRHYGSYDIDSLTAATRREAQKATA